MSKLRLKLYRKLKAALVATNRRTDNSIITECNIVMPLVNARRENVVSRNKIKKLQVRKTTKAYERRKK